MKDSEVVSDVIGKPGDCRGLEVISDQCQVISDRVVARR